MRILISGGTGLVGKRLTAQLLKSGHSITVLTTSDRNSPASDLTYAKWNPQRGEMDMQLFATHDAIINLAGANVGERWTASHKRSIRQSRIDSTRLLVKGCQLPESSIKTFLSTSAIGIYPTTETPCDEHTQAGSESDFLTSVCLDWERATNDLPGHIRKVILRLGIVLDPEGGALRAMLPVFRMGLGSPLGSGKQMMSWIHPEDVVRIYEVSLTNPAVSGIVNVVSPHPVSNRDFSKALARALRRPFLPIGVPAFLVKMLKGEGAGEAYKSLPVLPNRMTDMGYSFSFPSIEGCLNNLLTGA